MAEQSERGSRTDVGAKLLIMSVKTFWLQAMERDLKASNGGYGQGAGASQT